MANVAFKMGTQLALNSIAKNSTAQEGSFYLTSDSHRLYIGLAGGAIASVNEGVINVPNVAALPVIASSKDLSAGQFYYAQAENVLCVYNGSSWVQINPDTSIEEVGLTATATDNVATVTTTLKDTKSSTVSDEFQIKGISGTQITVEGTGPSQVIIAGDVYTVSTSVTPATTTDPKYNTAEINLTSQNQSAVNSKITLVGGDNVNIKGDAEGKITIAADSTTINEVEFTSRDEGGFLLAITDSGSASYEGTLDPIIKIGQNGSGEATETIKFKSGGIATLDVYTSTQVDDKIQDSLKGLDALVFKGTIGTEGQLASLPTENVCIGDLYKIVAEATYAEQECKIGDMLIAQGTESAETGFIEGEITWVYVPSGDGSDTTYVGRKTVHGMEIVEVGGKVISNLSLLADSDNPIQLSDEDTAEETYTRKVKIAHKSKTQTATTGTAQTQESKNTLTIPVETKTVDAYGHVTGTQTTNYTVTDTHNTLDAVTATVQVATNSATVTLGASMSDGESSQATFTVTSDNLVITEKADENINIDFAWGTF